MIPLLRVFFKLFVFQFYKLNVGFLVFFFFFFFGVVSPGMLATYHLALIQMEIESFSILAVVVVGWLFYNEKCLRCFKRIILQYQDSFLHIIQSLTIKRINFLFGICHIAVFLPVNIYALFVISVAISQAKYLTATLILSILVPITTVSLIRIKKLVFITPHSEDNAFDKMHSYLPISINFYLFRYILADRKINFLMLKILSVIIFYFFIIKNGEDFSKAWFPVILLFISYSHAGLIYHIHKFIEEKLMFLRNLPFSINQRALIYLIIICILFIPELMFMLVYGLKILSLIEVALFYLVLITQLMLFISILYGRSMQLKQFIKALFFVLLPTSYLFLVMDYRPLLLAQLLLFYFIFAWRYQKYEHIVFNN